MEYIHWIYTLVKLCIYIYIHIYICNIYIYPSPSPSCGLELALTVALVLALSELALSHICQRVRKAPAPAHTGRIPTHLCVSKSKWIQDFLITTFIVNFLITTFLITTFVLRPLGRPLFYDLFLIGNLHFWWSQNLDTWNSAVSWNEGARGH